MNGSATCVTCGVLTSDFYVYGRRYFCEEHAADGRRVAEQQREAAKQSRARRQKRRS